MESSTDDMGYCVDMLRKQDYGRYLQCAFAPQNIKDALTALLALNLELAQIHRSVREEMIGHVRYAWWQEGLEELAEGKARKHPVLQALLNCNVTNGLPLVITYREAYPEWPEHLDAQLDVLLTEIVRERTPDGLARWEVALAILRNHRAKHGAKRRLWLTLKFLKLSFT